MGNPVEPNGYDLGNPCVQCLGLATPKRVLAVVTGIKACPPGTGNPNGMIIMPQGGPCSYQVQIFPFTYTYTAWRPAPVSSSFTIDVAFFTFWFINTQGACAMSFINDQKIGDCGGVANGYDGTVNILYGPGI